MTDCWLDVDDLFLQLYDSLVQWFVGLALHVPLNQLVDGSALAYT